MTRRPALRVPICSLSLLIFACSSGSSDDASAGDTDILDGDSTAAGDSAFGGDTNAGDTATGDDLIAGPTDVHWQSVSVPRALQVWGHIVAPIDERSAVIFGGTNADNTSGTTLDGTFLYEINTGNPSMSPLAATGPEARYCGCAAWDPDRERVLLSGGRNLSSAGSVPAETWELDISTPAWSQAAVPSSPPGRIGCAMAYSPNTSRMYLFGGASPSGTFDTLYYYDSTAPAWVEVAHSGAWPSARYDPGFVTLASGELLLFAGSFGATGNNFYYDVWILDPTTDTWREVDAAFGPQGRRIPWLRVTDGDAGFYAGMGYDNNMTALADFWYFDLSAQTWTEIDATQPGARGFSLALPAGDAGLGVVAGGFDGNAPVTTGFVLKRD